MYSAQTSSHVCIWLTAAVIFLSFNHQQSCFLFSVWIVIFWFFFFIHAFHTILSVILDYNFSFLITVCLILFYTPVILFLHMISAVIFFTYYVSSHVMHSFFFSKKSWFWFFQSRVPCFIHSTKCHWFCSVNQQSYLCQMSWF